MATPQYSPISGYGTTVGGMNYVQTGQTGGTWSSRPQTPLPSDPRVLGLDTQNTPTTNNNTGGGGGGGAKAPQIDNAFLQEIDNSFGANADYLSKAAKNISNQQGSIERDINSLYQSSGSQLGGQYTSGNQQLDQQTQQAQMRKEDAWTAATRLYNELLTGGQQRFGGASSAGEAYGALAGRELQQNQSQIGRDFEGFKQQVDYARQNLKSQYDNAMQVLQTKTVAAINDARRAFQDKLLEIERLKNQNQQAKSAAKLSALQDLRNQVSNINLSASSAQNNLNALAQQLTQQVGGYSQQASGNVQMGAGAQQAFNTAAPSNYQTVNTVGYATPQAAMDYIGQLSQAREEEPSLYL